jgi:hypothetical protein
VPQSRLVLMAVGGVLLLCLLALVVTLADYTAHPAVAVAHIPPVVGTPNSDTNTPEPSPVATIPVTADTPTPDATAPPSQRVRAQFSQMTLAQLLQQLDQRRHHRGPGG